MFRLSDHSITQNTKIKSTEVLTLSHVFDTIVSEHGQADLLDERRSFFMAEAKQVRVKAKLVASFLEEA